MTGPEVGGNPFPGLRPFEPDEDYLFFGREREIDELLRRLRQSRFLAIVGGSGSGKSSLVRAGLVPSLHSGFMAGAGSHWRVAILRPGGDPFANLAAALNEEEVLGREDDAEGTHWITLETALRRGRTGLVDAAREAGLPKGANLLVVVDQFEELFRYQRAGGAGGAREEAIGFVKRLLHARAQEELPIYVALTLRSEYIGDSLDYPGLPEAINEGLYLVPRLTRAQTRLAITGPVAVGGAEIAPRLVSTLLNAVGDDPLKLPILQHALMRTWERWQSQPADGRTIDLEHYEAIGTIDRALSRHADEAFQEIDSRRGREIAERLFRTLTDTSSDRLGVRRPTPLARLTAIAAAPEAEVVAVIDRFRAPGRSFLLPPAGVELSGDSVIDISHESLMRSWRRLVEWADDERRGGEIYRRLDAAARLHEQGEAGLWRDPELAMALAWRDAQQPTADWAAGYGGDLERALGFLDASRRARDRTRRTLRAVVAAGLAAVLLAAATIFWLGRKAERNARELRAGSILIAARGADDPALRALLAAELDPDRPPAGGLANLRAIVDGMVIPRSVLRGHAGPLTAVAFAAAGDRLATGARDGTVRLWPADGAGDPLVLEHGGEVTALTFDPRGTRWLVGGRDGAVALWSADGEQPPRRLEGHGGPVSAVASAPDGATLASASEDGSVRLWTADGEPLAAFEHAEWVRALAFSPDGSLLVSASGDGTARLQSVAAGGSHRILRHPARLTAAIFTSDGAAVITGADDGVVRVWPVSGDAARSLEGHRGPVVALAASPDGKWLASASADATARVWPAAADGPPVVLEHPARLTGIAFSPGGGRLLTALADGTAAVWRTGDWRDPAWLRGHSGVVNAAVFSPDGELVASASEDGTARTWSAAAAAEPLVLRGHQGPVTSARFNPGAGPWLATGSTDRSARLWSEGAESSASLPHDGWVRSVDFSPDGSALLTAADDGRVRRWPTADAAGVEIVGEHPRPVRCAVFDAAGERVASASEDATVAIWSSAAPPVSLPHPAAVTSVAFAAEGRLVSVADDGLVRVWPAGGAEARQLSSPRDRVNSARPDAAGRQVVGGAADGTARIWSLDGASDPRLLAGHDGAVTDAVFSGDAALLATASADGTARVWRTRDLQPVDLLEHGARVNAVAFSPDGRRLVTASADGSARVWRIGWPALLEYLRQATNACLTGDQRVSYLGESPEEAESAWSACRRLYGRSP